MPERRRARTLMGLLALLWTGCPVPQPRPKGTELEEARRLVVEGKFEGAILEYARVYHEAEGKDDAVWAKLRGEIQWELYTHDAPSRVTGWTSDRRKQILEWVPALEDPTKRTLLGGAMQEFAKAMAGFVSPQQQSDCAGRLAAILRLKLDRAELRRTAWAQGEFEGRLFRMLLAGMIADYELSALVRKPAGESRNPEPVFNALGLVASELDGLALLPFTLSGAAAYWKGCAQEVRSFAAQARTKPEEIRLAPETRQVVDSDTEGQIRLAIDAHELALRRHTRNEELALRIQALETALRHATFVVEAISRPTARQTDLLITLQMDLDEIRRDATGK